MRRYGETPRKDQTYRTRPGVYAILPRGGRLLVTYQPKPEDEVQLPGGGIDPGESAVRALHREVWEETGWAIDAPRRVGMYRRFAYMPDYDLWAEKICHIYLARPVLRRGAPMEPGHVPLWLPPEDAVAVLANDGERDILRQVLAG